MIHSVLGLLLLLVGIIGLHRFVVQDTGDNQRLELGRRAAQTVTTRRASTKSKSPAMAVQHAAAVNLARLGNDCGQRTVRYVERRSIRSATRR